MLEFELGLFYTVRKVRFFLFASLIVWQGIEDLLRDKPLHIFVKLGFA